MNHDFYAVLGLIGKPVTYYPSFCHAFDEDVRCALFLSNFYHWEGKQHDPEGWIYKSQQEIKKETGLSRYGQETARKKLKELGVLEEKLQGRPPIMHYRFNWTRMNEILNKFYAGEAVEKQAVQDPLLYRMKVAFDEFYESQTNGIAFEWGTDRKDSGKFWGALKKLNVYFRQRLLDKKKKEQKPEEVHDDEIVNSWIHFLNMLPHIYVEKFLSPEMLYGRIGKIVAEIAVSRTKTNGNRVNQTAPSTPADWV